MLANGLAFVPPNKGCLKRLSKPAPSSSLSHIQTHTMSSPQTSTDSEGRCLKDAHGKTLEANPAQSLGTL